MMKNKKLILILVLLIFIIGCAEKECKIADDCISKTCSNIKCKDNNCIYFSISDCCGNEKCERGETYESCSDDCPNCDDNNDCTTDSYDYHEQKCINEPIAPCCGNGICDKNVEAYSNCPADCPNCDDNNDCTADLYDYHGQKCVNAPIPNVICCGNGACELGETYETCTRDCPNCDDENKCTEDRFDYHKHECVNELIIPCCGNGICDEGAETHPTCPTDCPNCDDNDKLTGDSFNYATQKCEYVTYYLYEDFDNGSASWLDKVDPDWSVVFPEDKTNGMLTNINDKPHHMGFGNRGWTNYTFRLKVKLEEGAGARPHVRAGKREGAYSYFVSIGGNQLQLVKDTGQEDIDLEVKEYSFALNQFYDIKIKVESNNIKVYIDGNLEISYTDTDNPLLDGRVALGVTKKVYFDDIIVEAP